MTSEHVWFATMKDKLEEVFGESWSDEDYFESINELSKISESPGFELMAETWKIYKIYKTILLKGGDFAENPSSRKIGKMKDKQIYIGPRGIGYSSENNPDIMWEVIPEVSITAIKKCGGEILRHLEGKKKDRFKKFYKIIKKGDFFTNYNNAEKEDVLAAKGIRRELVEEFKPILVNENI